MNQEATGKTYLDSLPAEALCEGGSRIYRSTILRQGYGWQVRSSASFTWRFVISAIHGRPRSEKSLERHLPESERRWAVAEVADEYCDPNPERRTLNT